jgi:hypothetical protein
MPIGAFCHFSNTQKQRTFFTDRKAGSIERVTLRVLKVSANDAYGHFILEYKE